MAKVRPPARAGQFYPASKKELKRKIEWSFCHELGPGEVPDLGGVEGDVKGVVVPHAGYDFSGPIAAHAFGVLAEKGFPETFVILGPKHPDRFGRGPPSPVAITKETFEMPFGEVPVDQDLAESLIGGPIEESSDMHASEHSIEVQLPFLQFFDDDFEFVPICVSSQDVETAERVGSSLREASSEKDIAIIASTDFTHCGPRYGQVPPGDLGAAEFAREQDEKAIEQIENLDPEGLAGVVDQNNITMCGPGGVEAMIYAVKGGVEGGELLNYATSQHAAPGKNAVGYAAIALE